MTYNALDIEHVVLVNELDQELGTMGKIEAHERGALHRAFSVFLFDDDGRLLLQRRASMKYHSAGLWTNTCCSHPRQGEQLANAAKRRLTEELGISADVRHAFSFVYCSPVGNGLQEHEFDHVFVGTYNDEPSPDPSEVSETRYITTSLLDRELKEHPERFTVWFRLCWDRVLRTINDGSTTVRDAVL